MTWILRSYWYIHCMYVHGYPQTPCKSSMECNEYYYDYDTVCVRNNRVAVLYIVCGRCKETKQARLCIITRLFT